MSLREIETSIEKIVDAFEEYKTTTDEKLAEVAKGRSTPDLDAKLEKLDKDMRSETKKRDTLTADLKAQQERLEEMEAKANAPGRGGIVDQLHDEHKAAFCDLVRTKMEGPDAIARMTAVQAKAQKLDRKDITIASATGGGYAVPEEIARDIERMEKKFSPVTDLVKVVKTGTSDYKELVNLGGATSGWVGESGSRSATATPKLRERAPTYGEIYAYPQLSEWAADDIFFNIEQWLQDEVADSFSLARGDAVIRGDGSNKPTGMLNTAPVATDDGVSPLRAAAAYEFVAALSTVSPKVAMLVPDKIIELAYTLNARYRANATWTFNSNTASKLRQIKDTTGQYLWQPSLIVGQPDRLLGYPIAVWEQMDDIGTNKLPIGFGDYKRAYLLVERVGLRMTKDNVTNVGFVRYYIRRREGGCVLNNDALKFLKTTIA